MKTIQTRAELRNGGHDTAGSVAVLFTHREAAAVIREFDATAEAHRGHAYADFCKRIARKVAAARNAKARSER